MKSIIVTCFYHNIIAKFRIRNVSGKLIFLQHRSLTIKDTLFSEINILQGSVETCLRYGRLFSD